MKPDQVHCYMFLLALPAQGVLFRGTNKRNAPGLNLCINAERQIERSWTFQHKPWYLLFAQLV